MPPAIPLRARLAGLGLLAVLIIHLSAVKVAPESTYAQKTQLWRPSSSSSSSFGGGIVEEQYGNKYHHDGSSGTASHHNANSSSPESTRANAAFVILARNSDLWPIMESIRSLEDRFNRKFK